MKAIRSSGLFALCLLITVCNADRATAQAKSGQSGPAQQTHAVTSTSRTALKLPDHFTAYASEPIRNNQLCVAGTITDEDGINQRPAAYVTDVASKSVLWVARPNLPTDMYQSRATHCTRHGNALFVLLQSDTQSEQSLSQTLLRVVKLDAQSGAVQLQQDVDVPTTYSAWVDEGSTHFQWLGDHLVIAGNDRLDSDHDRQATFTVRLNNDLKL